MLPTRAAGLRLARLPGSVRSAHKTAPWLRSTASRNCRIAARHAIGSPLSGLNDEKPAPRISHRKPKCYSISISPSKITATAAPAPSFLPPNRKRLGHNSEAYSKLVAEAFTMLANGYTTGAGGCRFHKGAFVRNLSASFRAGFATTPRRENLGSEAYPTPSLRCL